MVHPIYRQRVPIGLVSIQSLKTPAQRAVDWRNRLVFIAYMPRRALIGLDCDKSMKTSAQPDVERDVDWRNRLVFVGYMPRRAVIGPTRRRL